jgi:DNA excision repair protein ERCC-6
MIMPGRDMGPLRRADDAASKSQDASKDESTADSEPSLRNIEGVAGLEVYRDEAEARPSEEDRLMEGIFANSGIHSALEHDEIINGKKVVKADRSMLRQEANRVAAQAAAHLRRTGEQARNVPIGTVTWTGEVGEAGRPSNVRRGRGGPSSSAILAGISNRQGLDGTSSGGSRSATPSGPDRQQNLQAKDFVKMVPAYIKRHGGQVPSKSLVDHFNHYCTNARQASEFKVALEKVAKMEKRGSSGRAIWSLKPAYQ